MRRILPIACVAFAFTVGLGAQTTGTGSSTQGTTSGQTSNSPKSKGSKAGKAVTLTGCLREGDTAGTYQLTNVDMSSMGAKSGKGSHAHSSTATSGTTSSTESSSGQAGMGSMGAITLIAGGSVNLKEHVGHKVQVTGTWSEAGGSGTPGAEGTSGYNAETRRNNLGSAASIGGSSAGSQVDGTSTPTSPGIGDAPTAMPEQTGSQAGSQSGSQSSPQTGSKSTMGSEMSGRQLHVTSLKHISDTCQ